jgi:CubicO group peptidase (beta-lactamase class C family)
MLLGILAASPFGRVAIAQSSGIPARIDSVGINRLFAAWDRRDAPGYAVGIIRGDRLVYARGFGSADLDYQVPITSRTTFNVASLSKQFTAACIAILVRRGQVSLDDEVRRYITGFPAYPQPVRIKHLIYMTSGLPEYYEQPRPGGRTWDLDYFTVDDAIRASLDRRTLLFEPGSRWAYSNVNYMLLAEIVRKVSGLRLADFARREIFAPLGMNDSRFNDDLGAIIPNRATGYNVRDDGSYRQEVRRSPHYGGSGLFTTVEDLARWNRSFTTHQLGGPGLTALLLSTMKFEHDKANDAFGLVWGTFRGRRTIWYEGGDLGFSSYMVRLPDDQLSVIVLSNLGTGRAVDQAKKVLEILIPASN